MLVSVLYMDAADPGPVEMWIRLNSDPHHSIQNPKWKLSFLTVKG